MVLNSVVSPRNEATASRVAAAVSTALRTNSRRERLDIDKEQFGFGFE
jgi:hypothetical protein